jgi:hypothetical protein
MRFAWLLCAVPLLAIDADVCVYGGSSAGLTAALTVARAGKSVAWITPEKHVGGMSVEGLGGSDINNHWFRNDHALGGLALDFYRRIGKAYGKQEPVYRFESSVAEAVIEAWLREYKVTPHREQVLTSVDKQRTRIRSIRARQATYTCAQYIDASIEGDLLAMAGVRTVSGREANSEYNETRNGIRHTNTYRQFEVRIDPYKTPGDPKSGLIATVQDEPLGEEGAADKRIQGFCFRLCLTKNPSNRAPFAKPSDFDRGNYEIYLRYIAAGGKLWQPSANLPNGKTDMGSWHDLSLNLYGANHAWPNATPQARTEILRFHRNFSEGLLWFLSNDPAVPDRIRAQWRQWGLCADEFKDNGNWPRQLYVRDGRRMKSDFVLTEHHTRRINPTPVDDPVAVAYWPPDVHHVRRIVRDGAVYNEGFVFGGEEWGPFSVAWRSLLPRESEVTNLLTPTCPSSTHIAYGAIRLEWTFMALGESAAQGSLLALESNKPLQQVSYGSLRQRLLRAGQVIALNLPAPKSTDAPKP